MALSVYGRTGPEQAKTHACFEYIKQVIENNPGEPILYIVPEPATYTIERSLAEFMPNGGFTTVRVVGFNRLVYQVFPIGKVWYRETGFIGHRSKIIASFNYETGAGQA